MIETSRPTLGHLLQLLAPFSPTIAGTFPLGLQVEGSDVDILCEVPNLEAFEAFCRRHPTWFGEADVRRARHLSPEAIIVQLYLSGLNVEIFAQPLPVFRQHAFRHMIVEGRLLSIGGDQLARSIRALKAKGVKTEPAFAEVLKLSGDPYAALLELENAETDLLERLLAPFFANS